MRYLVLLFMFITGFSFRSDDGEVLEHLKEHGSALGIDAEDLEELSMSSSHFDRKTGLTYYYVQQRFKNYPIEGALSLVIRQPNKKLRVLNHTFISNTEGKLKLSSIKTEREILQLGKNQLPDSSLKTSDIDVHQLIWIHQDDAWFLTYDLRLNDHDEHWRIWVDASNGQEIRRKNLVMECTFHPVQKTWEQNIINTPLFDLPSENNGLESYLVYPLPIESPQHGDRQLVTAPSDIDASPFGWHDIDGIEGAEYTDTRGNNVFAQNDSDGLDISENRPDAGVELQFNYGLDLQQSPNKSTDATVTNLFFWNNLNHDIFYHYGFDEAAGNFQINNYQQGGLDQDQVFADAQDGSDLNNATFFVSEDGLPGRMQMYLWNAQLYDASIIIERPDAAPLIIDAVESGFSDHNKLKFNPIPESTEIILERDGSGGTHLACLGTSILNEKDIANKIVLVDRGNCFFVEKVKRLQDLGALAVMVGNNVPEAPFAMGGEDQTITIPAVMISMDQAHRLKILLASGNSRGKITARADNQFFDSSLDNLIITHEYGHGISVRLAGGANNIECLDNGEQMGEGWSDYFGLMLTTDWATAEGEAPRGIGTFVSNESVTGTGLRKYPYSTDRMINPMHYDDVKESPITHAIGAIWCAMLWDMTWNIIATEGVSTDIYRGQAGNNVALQLVVTGLKLMNCSPGFVDGRNAILMADSLLYDGAHQYQIWKAFALRGLGYSADQGSSFNTFDGRSAEDMPEVFQTRIDLFTAREQTDHINLDFNSLQEYDNKAFILQRSTNKVSYSSVTTFEGRTYEVNQRSFHYEDYDVAPGKTYYYRLLTDNTYRGERIIATDSAILIPVSEVLVFPNPSEGEIAVKVDRSIQGAIQLNLFSTTGQLIRQEDVNAEDLYSRYSINLAYLTPGVYILEVTSTEHTFRRKVLLK